MFGPVSYLHILLSTGDASARDIDKAMKLGAGEYSYRIQCNNSS